MDFNNKYDKSMIAFLKDCRKDTGNRDVWSFYGKRKTRDDFYDEIDRVATFLVDHDLAKGKSIAICLPNIPDAIVATYAVNKVGAIANIIHPLIPSEGLRQRVENIGSSALFIFDLFYEKHRAVIDALGIPTIVCSVRDYVSPVLSVALGIATHGKTKGIRYEGRIMRYKDIVKTAPRAIADEVRGEDIAVYLHSGGTTGSPKTVMLSNRALNACADKTRNLIGGTVGPEDSMLMVLPLFHGFGLGVCMHTVLSASGRVVLMAQFNAKQAIRLLKKEHITFIAGVPTMYDKMMNEPSFVGDHLKYLKHCYCGGDKLPEATKVRFDTLLSEAGNPISLSEGYGLTEVVTVCAVNTVEHSRFPSVGMGLEGVHFKIVSITDGATLPIGEVGEICVNADSMMSGYFGDEETTRKTMREDENGDWWIHTGDIGYLDEDGFLYFKDRLKRMVKIAGVNVFPKEIEEIVEKMPEVRFASAIASFLDGKRIIKLYVVMADGYEFNEDTKDAIRERIASELMKYSVPKVIEVRDSLPLTEIGKVDYKKLQEIENNNMIGE